MTINQLSINQDQLRFRFISAVEHYEYQNGARSEMQTRDPDTGHLLWKVRATIVDPTAGAATAATVTIPAIEMPEAEIDSEVIFDGLTVRFWVMNGTLGQSFTATGMKPANPTGNRKAPTTAAGKPGGGST